MTLRPLIFLLSLTYVGCGYGSGGLRHLVWRGGGHCLPFLHATQGHGATHPANSHLLTQNSIDMFFSISPNVIILSSVCGMVV